MNTKMFNNKLNHIYNKDCFQSLKKIPSESVDLVCVDPPYGINYKEWDKFDFEEFTDKWVKECFRILKKNGSMWSFMGYENVISFINILNKYGTVHLENWVIWARTKGRGCSKHLKSLREDILHITKSKKFTWNPLKMLRDVAIPYMKDGIPRGWFVDENGKRVRWTGLGNVWVYSAPYFNSKVDKQNHPAQKPYLLIERLILLSSNKNDIILDPFCGTGVVPFVCKNLKRGFIGFEQNKKYFDIANKRILSREKYQGIKYEK